ncbi:alpha-glucosidase-like [Aphidius gifuensis]|uniref:alpha-glucosidase-like n=1 Tax=Aphidius gifuensis TaxID=684658 RepID=UPI001CDC75AF|nr:alpha-glucosidase-like [Aphidius gifuensis]
MLMLRFLTFLFIGIGIFGTITAVEISEEWWRDSFIYHLYPRSFKDSDGDGIGDLNGITSKLEYLVDIKVSAVWIGPFYKSPMIDFGYDITNFTGVDPIFGTLDDFKKLTSKAKSLGLKVMLDFVPNHSSDQHHWFQKSIKRIKPYDNYYVWADAKIINGTRQPPNNWLSLFQGTAWTWNDERKQYYLHQFAAAQPDFNFRDESLNEEMKDVLRFWLNTGVDGFRIDTIPSLIEDTRLLDEPRLPNTGLPDTDSDTLRHIYTYDQDETYDVLKSWREVLDDSPGPKKIFLTEAYSSLADVMKYYDYGSNIPMNFMFLGELNNRSTAYDFKRKIDPYLNAIPDGQSANWVVGNHDRFRVATRFGPKRADQLTMLAAVLPGVGVIYNGDELGMENRVMTWEETVDPPGCNAGPLRYKTTSRDPMRTPFQWDNSTSAGFSINNKTWLPVHPNYKTINLAAQKLTAASHYNVFRRLAALKKNPVISKGTTKLVVINDIILGVIRRLPGKSPIVLLINFSDGSTHFDAAFSLNIPDKMSVYAASVGSHIKVGATFDTNRIELPGAASVILKLKSR